MNSMLCSITTSVLPSVTSRVSTLISRRMSVELSPVVGSSRRNIRGKRLPSASSGAGSRSTSRNRASLRRCASPPDSVEVVCPSRKYPSPTAISASSRLTIAGCRIKNARASSTVRSSTPLILKSPSRIARIWLWKRRPSHTSHFTSRSAMKCISIVTVPVPLHFSHRPPLTLNENWRLNSSHSSISYAVFCLKKKKKNYYLFFLLKKKKNILIYN